MKVTVKQHVISVSVHEMYVISTIANCNVIKQCLTQCLFENLLNINIW